MTKKKLLERKSRLEEQIKKSAEKLAELKKDHRAVTEQIKQIEDAEVIAYINALGISSEQAMEFIRKMTENKE